MPASENLETIREFAEAFANGLLSAYTTRIGKKYPISNGAKEVNDAIWGTIKLSALEVLIIDSPLLQRLRFVKQLGVVHWVYPGTTHSRFEHSLGVLHQAQQLINAINSSAALDPQAAPIDRQKAAIVRLCAIVHDVGHGLFSHVSEHALSKRSDVRFALRDFCNEHNLNKTQLSEVIAFYIIGSQAFQELLTIAFDLVDQPIVLQGNTRHNAERVASLIQNALIGRHIDEEIPLLHEIITGPFDADKLDYYVRDAHHAGIPSLLDISRLLQKIITKRVDARGLPTNIAEAISNQFASHYLFGLKWSGAAILDELHLARVLLYAKIYRHKKVQAIEAMIDSLFDALGTAEEIKLSKLVQLCYEYVDDQFLMTNSEELFKYLGLQPRTDGLQEFIDDTILRLRHRDLYVSALALRAKYHNDPWGDDKLQVRGLGDLARDCGNPQALETLRKELTLEVMAVAQSVPEAVDGISLSTLSYRITIAGKPLLGSGTEIDRALILQSDRFIRGRDIDRMNQPAWADAYNFGTPLATVFAPKELSAAVYVAAERLFNRKYGAILPNSAIDLSKQDHRAIRELKQKLEATDWYAGTPYEIRPIPARLSRQDMATKLDHLEAKFQIIDEAKSPDASRRMPELRQRIINWLTQFREDELIDCAIKMLERFRILGRDDSYQTLKNFIEKHPQFKGATICPLGDLKDSGAVQAYISRDHELTFPRTATVDDEVKRGGEEPIVFLDDFIGSGSQVIDILGNWFDESELRQEQLKEARLPFGEDAKKHLRGRPVAFVFLAGWKAGLERLREAATSVGLDATVYALLQDDEIPFAFEGNESLASPETTQRFQDKCQAIGRGLLAAAGKSKEKQEDRNLGYGNRAMLLASRLNVPTQTITCFWMDGTFDGVPWTSMIRRRAKA